MKLYHVIHENLEDDEGPMVRSEKTYPVEVASALAEALAEKYPNAYVDIMTDIDDRRSHSIVAKI